MLSCSGDWEGVTLGWELRRSDAGLCWGLGGGDAGLGTGKERCWAALGTGRGVMLGCAGDWDRVMLGWDGAVLGWDKTGTSMEQCRAGDWDGAMAGWKRTGQRRGCSPHPTAGGLQGAHVPRQAGCLPQGWPWYRNTARPGQRTESST